MRRVSGRGKTRGRGRVGSNLSLTKQYCMSMSHPPPNERYTVSMQSDIQLFFHLFPFQVKFYKYWLKFFYLHWIRINKILNIWGSSVHIFNQSSYINLLSLYLTFCFVFDSGGCDKLAASEPQHQQGSVCVMQTGQPSNHEELCTAVWASGWQGQTLPLDSSHTCWPLSLH